MSDVENYWSEEFGEPVEIRGNGSKWDVYIGGDYAFDSYSISLVEDLLGKMVVLRG